jgi:hypothetical protein
VDPLDWLAGDSDGDGVRDDADDVDHDHEANLDELDAELATPDKLQRPLTACVPNIDSRGCIEGAQDPDRDGVLNRDDADDDNDGLSDALEGSLGLRSDKADTDADGVTDGFEYESAIDLNNRALPHPGKRPYPNPLDGTDAETDFDGDSLSLREEYLAWRFSGSPATLSYSDGTQYTGGKTAVSGAADLDGDGFLSDEEKDLDGDGLSNWDELHGRMLQGWWVSAYNGTNGPLETKYYGRDFAEPNFADADSDGDGVLDGADDQDGDGFSNVTELSRPSNWQTTYVSTAHSGAPTPNRYARVQPFNPCKPINSDACHNSPPFGYYPPGEDWKSPHNS